MSDGAVSETVTVRRLDLIAVQSADSDNAAAHDNANAGVRP